MTATGLVPAHLELIELEVMLSGQAKCQSVSHRPGYACTVAAVWCAISKCDAKPVLWCEARHRQYIEVNLLDSMVCARCQRLIKSCWSVRPV